MSEKPRRWFQIHLSTAVVIMLLAGGLMFVQTIPSRNSRRCLEYSCPMSMSFEPTIDSTNWLYKSDEALSVTRFTPEVNGFRWVRSEERRVGKECIFGGILIQ